MKRIPWVKLSSFSKSNFYAPIQTERGEKRRYCSWLYSHILLVKKTFLYRNTNSDTNHQFMVMTGGTYAISINDSLHSFKGLLNLSFKNRCIGKKLTKYDRFQSLHETFGKHLCSLLLHAQWLQTYVLNQISWINITSSAWR